MTTLVLALIAILAIVIVGLGAVAFRRFTPLAFRCVRCGVEFHRKPWLRFPARCPACDAEDWNVER